MSQKPANDQHALAGLGETLVLKLENEKIYREVTQTGGFTTRCDASLGGISDE